MDTKVYFSWRTHSRSLRDCASYRACGSDYDRLGNPRLHYAETLRRWRERFIESHRREGRPSDERFCRMWEFYLASSELAFRYGGLMVFQAQLARQLDSVPLTRDYMYEREREA